MTTPTFETTFPHWHALSKLPGEIWKAPYDPTKPQCFEFLLFTINRDQVAARKHSEAFYAISSEIVRDLIALQAVAGSYDELAKLKYLQFEASAFALHIAISNGEASKAFDWIHNAVDSNVSDENRRTFDYGRFRELVTTQVSWVVAQRVISLQQWLANFYYYCRNWAALYPVAHELMPYAISILAERKPKHMFTVRGVLFALNWATAHKAPSEHILAKIALTYFDDHTLPVSIKAQIAIAFLTDAARLTDKTPAQWAQWALDHALRELDVVETLQVRLGAVETVADWDTQRENVLSDVDNVVSALRERFPQPSAFVQRLDQAVKVLDFPYFKLHAFGRSDALLELLCHWYGVSQEVRRSDPILFCMPNHASGTAYLGQRSYIFDHAASNSIETLVSTTNICLGVMLTLAGQVELEASIGRPGVPANEMSSEFDSTLSSHYHWEELDRAEYEAARALVCIPGYPHPLQYIMQRAVGTCLPISSSLEEPLNDRTIHHAVIWFSDEDNYSAMEAEAISGMMANAGVECTCMSGQDNSREDFLSMYTSSKYDLIWVAGHGAYDRWNPRSPSILVGRESEIGIDELLALSVEATDHGRRLLVLNICDSGAAGVFGGMHKLGLASMLASRKQAVIGHLWPVDPLVSAGIGIKLLRELLLRQGNFFEAFQETISSLQNSWERFVDNLAGQDHFPIFERLRNNERDLTNIFHAGSSVFFE
jgi:hypothetical protein